MKVKELLERAHQEIEKEQEDRAISVLRQAIEAVDRQEINAERYKAKFEELLEKDVADLPPEGGFY